MLILTTPKVGCACLLYAMMVYIRMLTNQVVQAARDHYNCSTLRGPLLENEGSELT